MRFCDKDMEIYLARIPQQDPLKSSLREGNASTIYLPEHKNDFSFKSRSENVIKVYLFFDR